MGLGAAYTRRAWIKAVNLSAVLGWLCASVPTSLRLAGASDANVLHGLAWSAALGLPIAFVVTWIVIGPTLWLIMHKPVSWARCLRLGVGLALAISAVFFAFGRFVAWQRTLNPNAPREIRSGNIVSEIDGVLTAHGWQVIAQNTVVFVGVFVAIALVVRAITGPGRGTKTDA